jgi:hypothetical protein
VYRQRQRETVAELGRFIRLGAAAGKIRDDAPEAVAAALLVSIQGYQNPIVMSPESEPIVAELAGMLVGLLEPRHPPR